PGSTTTFGIRFAPLVRGVGQTAIVAIANDDPDAAEATYDFQVKGTGIGPEISVTGNSLPISDGSTVPIPNDGTAFGVVFADNQFITKSFAIKNLTGDSALIVSSITATGYGAAAYSFSGFTAGSIAIGQTATVTVKFDPSVADRYDATIQIASNDVG